MGTPVIFHIAIQLPGTLAPGPSSTATWQGHRAAGSDGCCPSAHPTHPAAGRQPLLCQPRDHRQPAPGSCQDQGLRPRVSSSQHPNGQGSLPKKLYRSVPKKLYSPVSPPHFFPGFCTGQFSVILPCTCRYLPQPKAKKSHFKTRCRARRVTQ